MNSLTRKHRKIINEIGKIERTIEQYEFMIFSGKAYLERLKELNKDVIEGILKVLGKESDEK